MKFLWGGDPSKNSPTITAILKADADLIWINNFVNFIINEFSDVKSVVEPFKARSAIF